MMLQSKVIFEREEYRFVENSIIELNGNPDYCMRIVILKILN